MARQMSLMIVGAGDRGQVYADLAARDPRVRIAAVADPDEGRRTTLAERHAVPSTRRYSDWRDVINQPRVADAAVIATLDRLHHEPALALAEHGYHLLLEKPMAVAPEMCRAIVDAARTARVTPGPSWSLLPNVPAGEEVFLQVAFEHWDAGDSETPVVNTEQTDIGGVAMRSLEVGGP
jgi:predicted dehydrogenase